MKENKEIKLSNFIPERGLRALFRSKDERRSCLFLCFIWFTIYCVSDVTTGETNDILNSIMICLVQILGVFLVFWLIDKPLFGRKRTLYLTCFTFSFVWLLLSTFKQAGYVYYIVYGMNFFLDLIIIGCKALLYIYSIESYPTNLRSTGFGVNIIAGTFGSLTGGELIQNVEAFGYIAVVLLIVSGVLTLFLKETRIDEEKQKEDIDIYNRISMAEIKDDYNEEE